MVTCLQTDHQPQYTIHALLPHGADHAAFDWAKGHIVNAFGSDNVHIDEYSAAHNADSLIIVHMVAWVRSRSSCTQHTVLHTWLQHVGTYVREAIRATAELQEGNFAIARSKDNQFFQAERELAQALLTAYPVPSTTHNAAIRQPSQRQREH